jgi:amino acid transporter
MQILLIVGIPWAGIAAKQGSNHVVFWIAGTLLFFLPSAAVVSFCSRLWPEEGGVYQWVKHAMGPLPSFLSAWNLCLWAVLSVSNVGIVTATSLAYAFSPRAAWMATSQPFIASLTVALFAFILAFNIPGLQIGKWVSHFGTLVTIAVTLLLAALIVWHPHATAAQPHISPQRPFSLAAPMLTLFSLNLFAKIAFHSLGGIEQVAVFAGETRNPSRIILQSAWIAAPICALIYMLTTGSLLTYIPASQIDLIGPIPQVLAAAFGAHPAATGVDWGALLGRTSILLLALALTAQYVLIVAEASRLPMVAGWDGIVPDIFTRLHPRYKTPVWSISVIVALGLLASLLSLIGTGNQEAYQLMVEGANLCFAIYYLLMFLVPLTMGKQFPAQPGPWLKVASLSGISITVLAMCFSLVPIVPVPNKWLFALKIGGTALLMNMLAFATYHARTLRNRKRN